MLTVTKVDTPQSDFGMTLKGTSNELPMLVINTRNVIAMLVNHCSKTMDSYEADAVLLVNGDLLTGCNNGTFIKKLNLDYFKPYNGKLTIGNLK